MPIGHIGTVASDAPALDPDPARRLAQATGYTAETCTYNGATVSTIGVSGTVYGMPVFLRKGDVIANISFLAVTAAAALTVGKVGLYNLAGTLLASSASAHAAWNGATGRIATALSTPYTVTEDQYVYAAMISVGSTPPVTRMTLTNSTGLQPPTGGAVWPFWSQSGQADIPATATFAAPSSQAIWMGVN